jgi:hypothetical protein
METFIITLLITILAVLIILLSNIKKNEERLKKEIINKLNYINFKISKLEEEKQITEKEEDKVIVNESLLRLMDIASKSA